MRLLSLTHKHLYTLHNKDCSGGVKGKLRQKDSTFKTAAVLPTVYVFLQDLHRTGTLNGKVF